MMLIAAQADRFLERPGTVRVSVMRASGSVRRAPSLLRSLVAAQHAALELEVLKAVTLMRGFGLAHHGLWSQCFFMADTEPVVVGLRFAAVGQIGLALVANIKQVTEHFDLIALLTFAQQRRNRYFQMLAEQVEGAASSAVTA